MPMFPCVLTLNEFAVNLFCIDECNIAVVNLGLFVHEVKYSVRTRKSHNDAVDVLGNLADVVRKLSCHVQERNNNGNAENLTRE